MTKSEEIKKSLQLCLVECDEEVNLCDEVNCQYKQRAKEQRKKCGEVICDDAIAYITQLEQRIAQAESERDELEDECRSCGTCKFLGLSLTEHPCNRCVALGRRMMWQWRGVCEANSQ